jgi:hypothetical protein
MPSNITLFGNATGQGFKAINYAFQPKIISRQFHGVAGGFQRGNVTCRVKFIPTTQVFKNNLVRYI